MNRDVILESDNIYYVNVSYDLIDEHLKILNNPNIKKFLTADSKPYTYEDRFKRVKRALDGDGLILL